jgi:arylsulfatase A-like enzyme
MRAGLVSDAVWGFVDFLPTAAELGSAKTPGGLDGISVVPALHGKPLPPRDYLYWEFHEGGFSQSVRMGNWKGVRRKSRTALVELYDIVKDPGEANDLAASNPAVVKRISDIMVSARTESPLFPVREGAPAAARPKSR